MQPSPNLGNAIGRSAPFNRFYSGGGFTINPNGGEVFFELDFKEAVDYDASAVNEVFPDGGGVTGTGGTLSINDSINFVNYPNSVNDKINGVVFLLIEITHNFKNGLFTQMIEAKQPFLRGDITNFEGNQPQRETDTPSAAGDGAATGNPGERANSGLRTDPAANTTTPPATPPAATTPPES